MKILNARVNWMRGCENYPYVELLVDKLPNNEQLRYEERAHLYLAESDGLVSFMYHSGDPVNQEGHGGRRFTLTMKDGNTVTLVGPWSSRSGAANELFPECKSIEVSIFTNIDSWDKGHNAYSYHVRWKVLRDAVAKYVPDVRLVEENHYGEIYLNPRILDGYCQRCKGFGYYHHYGDNADTETACERCNSTGKQPIRKEK